MHVVQRVFFTAFVVVYRSTEKKMMCCIVKVICLLLLNLEWRCVTSLDNDGSTAHTDIVPHTELFTSALHTTSQVFSKTTDATDSANSLSHYSEQSESSLAATGEENVFASDFSVSATIFATTQASEVSNSVSSQVTAHSVTNLVQISSTEKIVTSTITSCPNTTGTNSFFLSTETAHNAVRGGTNVPNPSVEERDVFTSNGSVNSNLTNIPMSPADVSSYSTPSQSAEVFSTHSSDGKSFFSSVQVTSYSFTDGNPDIVSSLSTSVTEFGGYSAPFLSTNIAENSSGADTAVSSKVSVLATSSSLADNSTDVTPSPLTKLLTDTSDSVVLTTETEVMPISFTDGNIDNTFNTSAGLLTITKEMNIAASTLSPPSSGIVTTCSDNNTISSLSTEAAVTSTGVNSTDATPCLSTKQMSVSDQHTEQTTMSSSRSLLFTDVTGTSSSTVATTSLLTQANLGPFTETSTPCMSTEQASFLPSSPRTLNGTETSSIEIGAFDQTEPLSSQVMGHSAPTIISSNATPCLSTVEISVSASTPCPSIASTNSDSGTVLSSTLASITSTNIISSIGRTSNPLMEETSISASTACPPLSETEVTFGDNATIPCSLVETTVTSATDSNISTTPCHLAKKMNVSTSTPCPSLSEIERLSSNNGTVPCPTTQLVITPGTVSMETGISGSTTCPPMSELARLSNGSDSTRTAVSFAAVSSGDTTSCLSTNISVNTPCSLSSGTERSSGSNTTTIPCSSSETAISSATDIGTTPCLSTNEISSAVDFDSTSCLSTLEMSTDMGTTPCLEMSTGNGTTPYPLANETSTGVGSTPHHVMSIESGTVLCQEMSTGDGTTPRLEITTNGTIPCPLANETSTDFSTTPCLEMSTENGTTPCLLTKDISTEVGSTACDEISTDNGTTPCSSMETTTDVDFASSREIPCQEMSTGSGATPCLEKSTENGTTLCLLTNTAVGFTLSLTTKETSTSTSIPCPSSSGTERTFSDSATIPWSSTEADTGFTPCLTTIDIGMTTPCPLAKETSIEASVGIIPSQSTKEMSTDISTMPCHSTKEMSMASVSKMITEFSSTPYLEMSIDTGSTLCSTIIETSTFCPPFSETERTFSESPVIPSASAGADTGSTPCLTTQGISIIATGTPCPPSSGTQRSLDDSDTIPGSSSQAIDVSHIGTTLEFMTGEQSTFASTPCPPTSSIAVSTLSIIGAGTSLSYGALTDHTTFDYSTTYPFIESTVMFTSTASPAIDTTDYSVSTTDTDVDTVTTEFTTYDYVTEDDPTSDAEAAETEVDGGTVTTEFTTTPDYDTEDDLVSVSKSEFDTSASISTTSGKDGQLTSLLGVVADSSAAMLTVTSIVSPAVGTSLAVPLSYSSGTETLQSDISVSFVDDKNMSSASTTTMYSLPGNNYVILKISCMPAIYVQSVKVVHCTDY